jgi:hypothetical protein
MTRPVLVKAFLEGASIATLADLLGHEVADLEAGLRQGLIEISQDQPKPQPPASAEPEALPAPPARRAAAAESSPRPARRNQAARRAKSEDSGALDLTGYPESLQDPRATSQRAVLDALRRGPMTLGQCAEAAGLVSAKAWAALAALRQKNLVRGSEDTPVVWRIA